MPMSAASPGGSIALISVECSGGAPYSMVPPPEPGGPPGMPGARMSAVILPCAQTDSRATKTAATAAMESSNPS